MNRLLFKLKRRLRALFRRAELERELDAEVRFHLEKEIEQNVAQGHNLAISTAQYSRSSLHLLSFLNSLAFA